MEEESIRELEAPLTSVETVELSIDADTTVLSNAKSRNFGGATLLRVNRLLAQVDPSELSALLGPGDVLISAELEFTIDSAPNRLATEVTLFRLTQAWTEAGATWNCPNDPNPLDNRPDCDPKWTMQGEMPPFDTVATSAISIPAKHTGTVRFDVTTDVGDFAAGLENFGWITVASDPRSKITLGSRESSTPPRLILTIERSLPEIVINEVESSGGVPGDWVELLNAGSTTGDLSGYSFLDNDDTHTPYVLPSGTLLAPGGRLVLEEAAFGFGLGGADSARLFDRNGNVAASYSWTSHAPTTYGRCPDGTGELSITTVVTKGTANDCSSPVTVLINEVESSGGVPGDWVELYNAGASAVDVSGWSFLDNDDTHVSYVLPTGSSIPAGGYLVLEEAAIGFGLGSEDSARLFDTVGSLVDSHTWTSHAATSYGRCPDGSGPFATTSAPSKGVANECEAPASWPGASSVVTADGSGVFGGNLSGLTYQPATSEVPAVLWAVRNSPSTAYRLIWDGTVWTPDPADGWAAGKQLRYPDGTGVPDAEGVTKAEWSSSALYVATERDNDASGVSRLSILRFDSASASAELVATHEWDLTAVLPVVGANLGLEAITYVPDSFLVEHSFYDESLGQAYDPALYPDHGTGLFFVGVEGTGMIYAVALDHVTGSFTVIASIQSGSAGVMGLEFDRDVGYLWSYCDNTCGNQASVLSIDSDPASPTFGRMLLAQQLPAPSELPSTMNNEGFAIAPESECSGGLKSVFWTDDGATDGHALRQGQLTCGAFLP